jgi:hypothetical protein
MVARSPAEQGQILTGSCCARIRAAPDRTRHLASASSNRGKRSEIGSIFETFDAAERTIRAIKQPSHMKPNLKLATLVQFDEFEADIVVSGDPSETKVVVSSKLICSIALLDQVWTTQTAVTSIAGKGRVVLY